MSVAHHPDLLDDADTLRGLRATMLRVASGRYRIRGADAEDVVQTAFVTYMEVRRRYAPADHPAIVVGILRKTCLEHINHATREARRFHRYCGAPDAVRESPWLRGDGRSVLDKLARVESDRRIRETLDGMRPGARRIFALIEGEDLGRTELIAHFRLNKNTFDSRLRTCRLELRGLLEKKDLAG